MQKRTKKRTCVRIISAFAVVCNVALTGCTWSRSADDERTREEKTREEVAKATERAKPALENAGKKIGEAAKEAANQAEAAAEGVREGWKRGAKHMVNVNSATENELVGLPGINHRDARRIIEERPYRENHDLVAKGVIPESEYERIRERITSR